MTGDHEVTVQSVDVRFVKGEIDGVTIELDHSDPTARDPEAHKLVYSRTSSTTADIVSMVRHYAPDKWGEKARTDVNYYGVALDRVRTEGKRELERRNLDDPEDWRDKNR